MNPWRNNNVMDMTHLESILLTTNLRSVKIKNEFDGRQISRLLIDIKGITQQINPRASSTSSENRKIPITWHALKFLIISRSLSFMLPRSYEVQWGQVRPNGVKNYLCRSIFWLLTRRLAFFSLTFESQYQIDMF